jgi:hypothetical protein
MLDNVTPKYILTLPLASILLMEWDLEINTKARTTLLPMLCIVDLLIKETRALPLLETMMFGYSSTTNWQLILVDFITLNLPPLILPIPPAVRKVSQLIHLVPTRMALELLMVILALVFLV